MKSCIQEVARAIAGEDAAGAVRAVRSGGETDDHDARPFVTEARHGAAPVLFMAVGGALALRDPFAKLHEPRASPAGDDRAGGNPQRGHPLRSTLDERREPPAF